MIGALRWITYINVSRSLVLYDYLSLTSVFLLSLASSLWVCFPRGSSPRFAVDLRIFRFEAVMSNEFRTLQGACSTLVPQGPGYENVTIANQVCTTVGSLPQQAFVDGNRFLSLSYGFAWSNTWRVSKQAYACLLSESKVVNSLHNRTLALLSLSVSVSSSLSSPSPSSIPPALTRLPSSSSAVDTRNLQILGMRKQVPSTRKTLSPSQTKK